MYHKDKNNKKKNRIRGFFKIADSREMTMLQSAVIILKMKATKL